MGKQILNRSFESIHGTHRAETRVKGSRFIAVICPVSAPEEARDRLQALQREFPDASHHCWSYRIAAEPHDLERAQDAGEPAGTAGPPILQAIRTAGLINVLVVVIRYFGGTKLGRGGLVRAYRDAARAALQGAPRSRSVRSATLSLTGPLDRDGEVRHLLARHEGRVLHASYDDEGRETLVVRLPAAYAESLAGDLTAVTRGTWKVETGGVRTAGDPTGGA